LIKWLQNSIKAMTQLYSQAKSKHNPIVIVCLISFLTSSDHFILNDTLCHSMTRKLLFLCYSKEQFVFKSKIWHTNISYVPLWNDDSSNGTK
jgi:hypothetical protein